MKSLGANATKTALNGMVESGFPASPLFEAYVQDFCDLLRAFNLRVYLALAGPNEFVGSSISDRNYRVGRMANSMSIFMKHGADLLVGIDLANEVNFHRPSTWPQDESVNSVMAADLAYFLGQIRSAAPGVPLTFSVYMHSRTGYNDPQLKLQSDLGCDFHDYHPYYNKNNTTTITSADVPMVSDMAQLEAQSWYIGADMIGECGALNTNSTAGAVAHINGMAAHSTRPKSVGGVYFGDRDYSSSTENGNYGITGIAPLEAAFKAWPYSQI
jgi:hypothetical protein